MKECRNGGQDRRKLGPILRSESTETAQRHGSALSATRETVERAVFEERKRIAHDLDQMITRRLVPAELDLYAVLALTEREEEARRLWRAIGELDEIFRETHAAVFGLPPDVGSHEPSAGGGRFNEIRNPGSARLPHQSVSALARRHFRFSFLRRLVHYGNCE